MARISHPRDPRTAEVKPKFLTIWVDEAVGNEAVGKQGASRDGSPPRSPSE